MTNIAVILAGGTGKRAGEGLPKQFRTLPSGQTVLLQCVQAFLSCPDISHVCVVMHPDWMEKAKQQLPSSIQLIAGGKERWESSWNAIQQCSNDDRTMTEQYNIILHDCARPFVSQRILQDVCSALCSHEAVTVAVPAIDTMYYVENREIQAIPNRATMFRAQTPQAFRLEVIRKAYELALQDSNLQATDDCGILHHYLPDVPIYIVKGEETNRKLTFQEDFML